MKRLYSISAALAIGLTLVLVFSGFAAEKVEPEEVDLALVNSIKAAQEASATSVDIKEVTDELGYELVVKRSAIDLYLAEGGLDTVLDIGMNDVTEEVDEIIEAKGKALIDEVDDLEMAEEQILEFDETEFEETIIVLDITDEVIAELTE
ncbi:MAG: hypothetical protein ACOCZX_04385 [Candidatus Bipolaricaulota bacterium]